ncbi:MAG: hypothetical protein LBP64_01985 [Tannerella sp.]|jgi:hypothetical protein|nr:hypothetical protein [Tannerella sp.]
MKTKVLFLVMLLFSAIAASSQISDGFRVTYPDGSYSIRISKTFILDSVKNWGDTGWQYGFVNTVQGEYIGNIISFEYPPIHITPLRDYLIVQRKGGEAAFCLDEGFEMTWKENLNIKDSFQSQLVGLDKIVTLKIEKRTYGYVNPSIRGEPVNYSRYLQIYGKNGPFNSFSDSYVCTADENDLIFSKESGIIIRVAKKHVEKILMHDAPRGNIYW